MRATPKTSAPRRFRRHGDAPANWQYRAGRPRWIPSPSLRKAGWKALDLKDARGGFLPEGASRDRAREINAAVAAWRDGRPVPLELAAIAPAGAAETGGAGLPAALDKLSIGRLIDAWQASHEWRDKLSEGTQRDYRGKLKRLVDVLAGWVQLPARDDPAALARYAEAVAQVRAQPVFILEPEEGPDGMTDLLHAAYWTLRRQVGAHQASGVMAAASAWLAWCRERQSRRIHNWAREVRRETPPGRLRTRTWEEVRCMIRTADRMGWPSIGDAIVLGLDLSWSQVDRLALTWDRVIGGRCQTARQKTGRVGGTPLLDGLGLARLPLIRSRQQHMDPRPTHVLVCETTGRPWKADHYRHVLAEIRAEAARELPSLADFVDAHLRATAFTWGREAGFDDDMTAGRTLQSRRNVQALGDRHYGEIGPAITDAGAAKLNAWLAQKGVAL